MKDKDVEAYLTRQVGITPAQWEEITKGMFHGAKCASLYFRALTREGFSEEYAMRIICAHGCSPKYPWDSTPRRDEEA